MKIDLDYLHWFSVDKETVELCKSFAGTICTGEDDVGDTTAGAVWSV
jgi:hypothetical protein